MASVGAVAGIARQYHGDQGGCRDLRHAWPEENVALLFREESLDLILRMLHAKAKNIVADIQIYRGTVSASLGHRRRLS
jgi:hypothetical protein